MKLRLTLHRATGPVDVAVTADATASVADVAGALLAGDPQRAAAPSGPVSADLRVLEGGAARVLDPTALVGEAGLRSGSHVDLVVRGDRFADAGADRGAPAALLRVLSGPDAGREYPLPFGSSIVGRDRDVDVRLTDGLVSKRHARLNVADAIEVIDLNSSNGVEVGGGLVERAQLDSGTTVVVGDTSFCVVPLRAAAREQPAPVSGVVEHVRSPRVVPPYRGETFVAPAPPKLPAPHRFPWIALAAPLIMGMVVWAITQQLLGVVMMALSPILLVGAWFDQSITTRRTLKAERARFDEGMRRLHETLEAAQERERRVRGQEHPPLADLERASERLGPLLWSERAEHRTFLAVSLGIGRDRSRSTVELPASNETLPDCWDQLVGVRSEYATIAGVPVVADLRSTGALGVAGPAPRAGDAARALVFQLTARHSPADLAVAAIVAPASRDGWSWLKWLPHTGAAHSPLDGAHLADSPAAAQSLLSRIEGLIDDRVGQDPPTLRGSLDPERPEDLPDPVVPALLLVVENDAPADRARLTRIVERGADAGVHVVWCAPRVDLLPAACRAFLQLDETPDGVGGIVRTGDRATPLEVATLARDRAEHLARALAAVVDAGVPERDDSDLPRAVSYAALAGREVLDEADGVIERWAENHSLTPRDGTAPVPRKQDGHLRALVGVTGADVLHLDLRRDGPHALVGGTTGAGKSEFLQTWVLGMAAANSPDRLTFLFVDYKGGAAFADCVKLPHSVGIVTDLAPHLVRRALTSLRAELRHREELLRLKGEPDLASLERSGDPDCPPSLVIVVDEFAALVQDVPEFVDGVVDVAQRGRSLGLHLVLATQRPAGVIKDNLRANTNLRIALRMADAEDSSDILGEPMAAHFDPGIPGRAAVKTGPGRIRTFQTGYAGGWTTDTPPRPRIDVRELGFGEGPAWEPPETGPAEPAATGPKDIARIVTTIGEAAARAGVPEPRRPWLDSLAPVYDLKRLPNRRTDEQLLIGVIDRPDLQAQPAAYYEPDRDGNMVVFGTGGSGKSTALRTIAASAAMTTRGGPVQVYALDFGAGGLKALDALPHVGAVIPGDDEERVARLLRMLRDLVDERAVRYAAVNAATITEYRGLAGRPDEPRVLLLIDGIGAFRDQYEFGSAQATAWFAAFTQVANDGRQVGVHVVMTGDRANAVPTSIASTVQRRIVLRLASEEEYLLLGVPKDILTPLSPPGRGILGDQEVQLAVLGDSDNLAVQGRELVRLGDGMRRGGIGSPPPVRRLPDRVRLDELAPDTRGWPVLGLDDLTLGPAAVEPRGTLMLSGPPGSGRTTALATIASSLRRSGAVTTVFLAPRASGLSRKAGWTHQAIGATEVAALAGRLAERLEADPASLGRVAVLIESVTDFTGGEAEFDLDRLIKAAVRADQFVVGEAETSTWSQAYTLGQPFKAGRRGILLVPSELDPDLLGAPLGRLRRTDFPAGRGFVVTAGRAAKVQVAEEVG
ncbi:FtsK/SpoIIIE domain-containing protein [Agromyces sp. MMS24-K17]|uniref:FtsK/SpoIIIE domain-containing protein n=1 Tax=Agromyces sp. MMS24-K17 TaxID=3372850 RepID=UPI00375473AB